MNVEIISFKYIFQVSSIKALNDSHCFDITKFDSNFRKILLHHVFYDSLEFFVNNSIYRFLLIDHSFLDNSFEIYEYFNFKFVSNFVFSNFRKVQKVFPIPLLFRDFVVDFNDEILIGELMAEGEQILADRIRAPLLKDGFRKFSKRRGLIFLSDKYINTKEFEKLLWRS